MRGPFSNPDGEARGFAGARFPTHRQPGATSHGTRVSHANPQVTPAITYLTQRAAAQDSHPARG